MPTVVCLTASEVALPELNVSWTFFDSAAVFAMRMSLCHCELKPGRWPTDGMTSAVAAGAGERAGADRRGEADRDRDGRLRRDVERLLAADAARAVDDDDGAGPGAVGQRARIGGDGEVESLPAA